MCKALIQMFQSVCASCTSDPLVHHGRHFGRTIHALTNIKALITNGLLRMDELAEQPEEFFTTEFEIPAHNTHNADLEYREQREHRVFNKLLQLIPGLEERLMEKSEEEATLMAELVTSRSCIIVRSAF
jgi:hypothetical protein